MEQEGEIVKTMYGYTMKQLLSCAVCFAVMIVFGTVYTAAGVLLPLIKDFYHFEYDFQGFLYTFSSIGYISFSLIVGTISNRCGIVSTLLYGLLIWLGCYCVLAVVANKFVLLILLVIVGIGNVFLDVGANVWGSTIFIKHKAVMMNLLHSCFGLGSVLGPLFGAFVHHLLPKDYRGIYIGYVALTIIGILFVLVLPKGKNLSSLKDIPKETNVSSDNSIPAMTILGGFQHPIVLLMGLSFGCAAAIESFTTHWSPFYFRELYQWEVDKESATFIASFFLLFTISRLVSGFFIDLIGEATSAIILSVLVTICFLVGFLVGKKGIWLLSTSGFFDGPLWPTLMTVNMDIFGSNAPLMVSIELFISSFFSALLQWLIGVISKHAGVEWGYRLAVVISAILLINTIVFKIILVRQKKAKVDVKAPLIV